MGFSSAKMRPFCPDFNNSVLVQGRVVPPSALKLRSAGAREDSEALYQGCRESPGSATNLARENCSRSGTRIHDHKVAYEQMLVGQRPCKKASTATEIGSTRGATRSSEIGSTRRGLTQHSDVSDHRWDGSARQQFWLHCVRHSVCPAAEASGGDFSTPRATR